MELEGRGRGKLTSARAILHHTDHTLGKHFAPECIRNFSTSLLSPLYYKTGSIRCLGLLFSDRTVRLIEIFGKNSNQVV